MTTKKKSSQTFVLESAKNDVIPSLTPLFEKRTIVELSDMELVNIIGGGTRPPTSVTPITTSVLVSISAIN